jgi:hypothetical protein
MFKKLICKNCKVSCWDAMVSRQGSWFEQGS